MGHPQPPPDRWVTTTNLHAATSRLVVIGNLADVINDVIQRYSPGPGPRDFPAVGRDCANAVIDHLTGLAAVGHDPRQVAAAHLKQGLESYGVQLDDKAVLFIAGSIVATLVATALGED